MNYRNAQQFNGSLDHLQFCEFKNKGVGESSEYTKKFNLKEEVGACRAVCSSQNLAYL